MSQDYLMPGGIFGVVSQPSAADGSADPFQRAIERERINRHARRVVDAEERGPVVIPAFDKLRDGLAQPRSSLRFRVDRLQPIAGRVMLSAQFKAGKTTVRDNLVRSLVDGDPFLGEYRVVPIIDGSVIVVDFEMSPHTLYDWLRDQSIRNDDRVIVLPMRGTAAAFDITIPEIRCQWADRLRAHGCRYLILDCLRPVLDAIGLDENTEAGRFLTSFDALLTEAGIPEAAIVQHMGHAGQRARGDSRLRDWPDAEWRLVRRNDDPASARFFAAYGRDVEVPESELAFDAASRRLTLAGGSRKDAKAVDALADVVAVLQKTGTPQSGRSIKAALAKAVHSREAIEAALTFGSRVGALHVQPGPRNSKLYIPGSVPVSGSVPSVSRDTERVRCPSVPALYKGRTLGHSEKESESSDVERL